MYFVTVASIFSLTSSPGGIDSKSSYRRNDSAVTHYISAIFDQANNVDIVMNANGTIRMDQLNSLFAPHLKSIFRNKSYRIYEEDYFKAEMCNEAQNQPGGYVIYCDLNTFGAVIKCLFDPDGTYLIVLTDEVYFTWDEIDRLLRTLWNNNGAYRLFISANGQLYTFDPFARNGSSYGALRNLAEADDIPQVPSRDFEGYPLRVRMLCSTYSKLMFQVGSTSDFYGPDVIVAETLANSLNITPIFVSSGADDFGDRLPNGSFSGTIGSLARHENDIAFVGYFVKDYHTSEIEFTAALYTDKLCCLVRKADRVPEYLLPFTIFAPIVWILLFLVGVVSATSWIVLRFGVRLQQRRRLGYLFRLPGSVRDGLMWREMIRICVDTYVILLGVPYKRFTRSGTERLLLFGIMAVSLVVVSMFQSRLSSVYVKPVYYRDIEDLHQLDDAGLKIPVRYKGFLDDVFPANYSAVMDSLRDKMSYHPANEATLAHLTRMGTTAMVIRKSSFTLDSDIYSGLYMIPDCPRVYNLAYIVPRHSVLLDRINAVLLRMLNGGLINHWIAEMNYNVTLRHMALARSGYDAKYKVLTMIDMQFPFYMLTIGLAISMGVFIFEHVCFRCVKFGYK